MMMKAIKHNYPIPAMMKDLAISDLGYPVPYFVPIIEGKPNFALLNEQKQLRCIEHKLCGICGKKLYEYMYFITGPVGYKNGVVADPGMHRECAEYSINVCPHMYYQKATRKDISSDKFVEDPTAILEKPEKIFLIKANKYKKFINPRNGHTLIKVRTVSAETYTYVNGILQKENL